MSVLNDEEIRNYCEKYRMIEPFDDERVQPASYDLSVGDEYRLSHEKRIIKLGKWKKKIKIPPYTICYVLIKEKLNIPVDVSAEIYPRHELVKKGLLIYPQPPIDPGYKGKLYVLIHNLTNENRTIKRDDHLVSLVFHRLTQKPTKPYDGKYQDKETLDELGLSYKDVDRYTSALKEVSEKIQGWREGLLSKWIPILLILITVFLMVLTVLIGWGIIK